MYSIVPRRFKILYVDDEPSLLEIGRIFLEDGGTFAVDTSLSATEVLSRLASVQYDAIVSDYQMPGMDGITFLKELRSSGDNTPFIIFTGKGREEVVIEALNNGADFYLQKGGDPKALFAELIHKIHRAIQKRQTDLALIKSERDYRSLFESANEGILVIQDRVVKMINPKALEISGFSEGELLNQPCQRIVHPADRGPILDRYHRQVAGENIPSMQEFRLLHKGGAFRQVELNLVPITWDERPATLLFLTDITDRRQTEDALRESEERYRLFFMTTLDSVFITTPDGRYIDCNDALIKHMNAASREEVLATNALDVYVYPGDRSALLEQIEKEGIVREHPVQLRRLDGTTIDALISMVPQKKPDGSVKAYIGTVRDLTGSAPTGHIPVRHKKTVPWSSKTG